MIPEDEARARVIGMVGAMLVLLSALLVLHIVSTSEPDRVQVTTTTAGTSTTVVTVTPATASVPVPAVIKEEPTLPTPEPKEGT